MGQLKKWSDKNSKFVKIEDGQTIEAVFEGYKIITSHFDSDREVIRYLLKIDDTVKPWETGASTVAVFFDTVQPGEKVRITRHGTGKNTTFECQTIKG